MGRFTSLCNNPVCVNPDHFILLEHIVDNMVDMVTKDRHAKIKPRGEKHGNTKLSDRDFLEIFQLLWSICFCHGK